MRTRREPPRRRRYRILAFAGVLLTVLAVSGLVIGPAAADEAADLDKIDGEGTEADPYVVTTVEELQAMNQDLDAHYVLGNDIDARETDDWNAGLGFEPIGDNPEWGNRDRPTFSGTFDGNDYSITELAATRPNDDNVAAFGGITGTVQNVQFENVRVTGEGTTGGVVGWNDGTVSGVTVSGSVDGNDRIVGGLTGRVGDEGSVERSMAAVDVSGTGMVGGLVGQVNNEGQITESYATGSVEGVESDGNTGPVGGLVGLQFGPVSEVYTAADVSPIEGDLVSGLVGQSENLLSGGYSVSQIEGGEFSAATTLGNAGNEDLYFDSSVSNNGGGSEADTGLQTGEMTGAAAEENMNLDFDEYWTATDEYPILQWQVEDVDLSVAQSTIGEGESTPATVELTLHDGSTVTASEVADYDSETAIASVEDGSVEANSIGQTDITATVAGQSDTVTVEVLEPPSIEFVDAQLDTEAVVEGTTAQVSATYENTGGPGSETVSVAVDDDQASLTTFQLDADEETTETITWSAEDAGPVSLDDTELGELEVVDPANVSLQSVELPEEATQDREYEIEPVFETDLDTSVWTTLEVRVDDDQILEDKVEVREEGSVDPIEYAHDEDGTTTHVVEHYDQTETGTVEVLPPADFELDDLEVAETVEQDDTETVGVTVRNVGGGIDDADIALALDGNEVDSQAVTLDRNEDTTVEFDATFDEEGDVELAMSSPDDELTQSVTVEADGDDEADDDGLPGFTPVAGLIAVLLTAGFIARRR